MNNTPRRPLSKEEIAYAWRASGGICHLCSNRLTWEAYGQRGHPRGWHVDHRRPLQQGGTYHPNNLRAACIDCNQAKGARSTPQYRYETENNGYNNKSDLGDFLGQKWDNWRHRDKKGSTYGYDPYDI